jgi:hypothetical protein
MPGCAWRENEAHTDQPQESAQDDGAVSSPERIVVEIRVQIPTHGAIEAEVVDEHEAQRAAAQRRCPAGASGACSNQCAPRAGPNLDGDAGADSSRLARPGDAIPALPVGAADQAEGRRDRVGTVASDAGAWLDLEVDARRAVGGGAERAAKATSPPVFWIVPGTSRPWPDSSARTSPSAIRRSRL